MNKITNSNNTRPVNVTFSHGILLYPLSFVGNESCTCNCVFDFRESIRRTEQGNDGI